MIGPCEPADKGLQPLVRLTTATSRIALGRKLHIDPKTGDFVNDAEASNDLLFKRPYREPWVVPEKV